MATTTSRRSARGSASPRVRDEARALYRRAILDAAEEVFGERGFAAARVQDVAARAGLAVGTIYNHFGQKEDILLALLEERTKGFLDAFAAAPDDPTDARARLEVRVARLLGYVSARRTFFQLASEHGLLGSATAAAATLLGGRELKNARRYEEMVAELVRELLGARVVAARPPRLVALHLRNSIRSVVLWMRSEPEMQATDAAREAVALFLDGASAVSRSGGARPRTRASSSAGSRQGSPARRTRGAAGS